jgi:hypothetical protein
VCATYVLFMLSCRRQPAPLPLRVLRSTQLDAQRLDAELQTMLQEQFMAVFQLLPQVRLRLSTLASPWNTSRRVDMQLWAIAVAGVHMLVSADLQCRWTSPQSHIHLNYISILN